MTNTEILTKAIEKAETNGWKGTGRSLMYTSTICGLDGYRLLIFDHEFARALWPGLIWHDNGSSTPAWIWHIQQMVIVLDPIKYLEENM